jgi:serine protease Do
VNEQPIRTGSELRNTIGLTLPGTRVQISFLRDGRQQATSAVLAASKSQTSLPDGRREERGVASTVPLAGVHLSPLPAGHPLARELNGGVLVTEVAPTSDAAKDGLQSGDVIVSVNRRQVRSPDDVRAAAGRSNGAPVLLNVRRGDAALFIAVG